jgi:hypothetical protein
MTCKLGAKMLVLECYFQGRYLTTQTLIRYLHVVYESDTSCDDCHVLCMLRHKWSSKDSRFSLDW